MFATIDMTQNYVLATAILVVATIILCSQAPTRFQGQHRGTIWVRPFIALVLGPLFALSYWALDVFILYPEDYTIPSDRWETFLPVMGIGVFIGGLCALSFFFAQTLKTFFSSDS